METRARYALIGVLTLGIIAAFAFAYWLRSAGGFSERVVYRIRFESPVTGLLPGSRVLFNGIPVGEVTGLALDAGDPHQVMVTIAVDSATPVRGTRRSGSKAKALWMRRQSPSKAGRPRRPRPVPTTVCLCSRWGRMRLRA
ncbi:MlaD family protein [Microvirga aerilata]|uniref:MlaD family protein n=1 Tax=Microvirga aerilata TaxID=670292 RepID=UPI003632C6AF